MKTKHFFQSALYLVLLVSLSACNKAPSGAKPVETAPEAAKWPAGSVQMLVPSKAGGVTDIFTRYVQKYLQTNTDGRFGTVNYDNEAVAYENLRSARPDGATLLFNHSTIICKYLTGSIELNPAAQFKVVGIVADMGNQAIIVSPKAPYNTWGEFTAYAKQNPGKVNTAISTNGTTHFIFGLAQKNLGITLNFLECAAEADKLINVAGGFIDMANCSLGNAKEYETAGKIKVLGLLGSGKPEENYPQWAPITDVLWESYLYCFAPAGIDDAAAEAINAQLKGLVDDPEYAAECRKIGGRPVWFSLKDSQKHFDDTMNSLREVATALGINKRL
jgi:tripartite-type tricarboxylate transporter receptor subunit TctC